MSGFSRVVYDNFVSEQVETQKRVFAQYDGSGQHFDFVIVGSGMGGGILADDLVDRLGPLSSKRVLVLEAGSYLFPTHVYNVNRFSNADVARKFAVKTFAQAGTARDQHYIHERPQLNLGGRSVFWSGLIPSIQPWEFEFFPPNVRADLTTRLMDAAHKLNASITMGSKAKAIVAALRQSPLAFHFEIQETPRALHQPYLTADGSPSEDFWIESTGVFNTAELLINQVGLKSDGPASAKGQRLQLLLNHYLESVNREDGRYVLTVVDVLAEQPRQLTADVVVLAAGSIESPKIVRRSPLFEQLPAASRALVGKGLTDHPTTDPINGLVTRIGGVSIPRNAHAKIIFYSRGRRDSSGSIIYPFNVEMNVNHEYWHLRENDPTSPDTGIGSGPESIVDIKFSFGNLLDDNNEISFGAASPPPYVPQIRFKNLNWLNHLAEDRFKALAGWNKSFDDIWWTLNEVTDQIFRQFQRNNVRAWPEGWYNENNRGFGLGTVHHAVGTLRMPNKSRFDAPEFSAESVVDEDLMVLGHPNLYVCDMSVLPYASSANPVRTLAALALRLSERLTH